MKTHLLIVTLLALSTLCCVSCTEKGAQAQKEQLYIYAEKGDEGLILCNDSIVLKHSLSNTTLPTMERCGEFIVYRVQDSQKCESVYIDWEFRSRDSIGHKILTKLDSKLNIHKLYPLTRFNINEEGWEESDNFHWVYDTSIVILNRGEYEDGIITNWKENKEGDFLITALLTMEHHKHQCYWINGVFHEIPKNYRSNPNDLCYVNGHLYSAAWYRNEENGDNELHFLKDWNFENKQIITQLNSGCRNQFANVKLFMDGKDTYIFITPQCSNSGCENNAMLFKNGEQIKMPKEVDRIEVLKIRDNNWYALCKIVGEEYKEILKNGKSIWKSNGEIIHYNFEIGG